MKILITGNAGMIGSVISRDLIKKGYNIVGIDNLSGGFVRNIPDGVTSYNADITDHAAIDHIFEKEKPSHVIHCAAFAAEVLSPFVRRFNYSTNIIGSINIINAAINNDCKKIINFSSIASYGGAKPPVKEDQIKYPIDCYGISKYAIELDLQEAMEHFGIEYSNVVPHNVVSKYQNYFDNYRNAIAIWVRQCYLGQDITIFGDGEQTRAFSDCKFLCDPIETLLTKYNGFSFNLGSDTPTKIKDAAQQVIDIWKKIKPESNIKLLFLEPRKELKHIHANHDLAKKYLNFKDETNLSLLIEEMFDFIKSIPREKVTNMEYEINKKIYGYWK
jgi:UDP-glucose 4-epimerase